MAGPAASVLSIGSTALSAFSSYDSSEQAGQQQAEMDNLKSQQLANAAEFSRAQARQTDAYMRANLMKSVGNIEAIRASAGTNPDSPTGNAIINRTQGQGDQERAIKVGDIMAQAGEDQTESGMYASAASQALSDGEQGGILGGLGKILSGVSGLKFS